MTLIRGLHQAEESLARLDIASSTTDALGVAVQELEAKVIEVLSQPPGQDHSAPWLRTGDLRESISHDLDGMVAVVGSLSNVAVDQELGTHSIPPRSFLAATAASEAEDIAALIAASLARHLAGR